MALDHIGYFLFPSVLWLRIAGRLAFPLFAFFIGEGARYTKNRKKYLLQLLVLGLGCQSVYFIEEIVVNGVPKISSGCWFFNILLTFALAVPGVWALLDAKKEKTRKSIALFLTYTAISFGGAFVLWALRRSTASAFYFDYGLSGLLLPLATAVFDEKYKKLAAFCFAVFIYCAAFFSQMNYVVFSLFAVILLVFYNNKPGSPKFKYGFYAFYPAHLGLIYLIAALTGKI